MLNFRMIIESAGRFFSQVSKTSCQSILQQGQIGADYENWSYLTAPVNCRSNIIL